jgi:anti-sigma factor (TIGR02949 family)
MSCEGMNCDHAMEQLWALIDQELDLTDAAALREHLDACQRCYPEYDFQRAYRAFIASRCRHAAPPDLRRRVFMSLLAEEERA